MSTKKNRHKKPPAPPSKAGRVIAWTTVLALVFSAGLITGQRLIERQGTPPLVSISSAALAPRTPDASDDDAAGEVDDAKRNPVAFSFYDRLSGKKTTPGAPNKELSEAVAQLGKPKPDADTLPARYTLQIGAHPAMHKAKVQLTKLRERGLEPHVVAVDSSGEDSLYRVRIGKFHSMDEARHFQAEIQNRHDLSAFITPL